jgi:hypothetical protein
LDFNLDLEVLSLKSCRYIDKDIFCLITRLKKLSELQLYDNEVYYVC